MSDHETVEEILDDEQPVETGDATDVETAEDDGIEGLKSRLAELERKAHFEKQRADGLEQIVKANKSIPQPVQEQPKKRERTGTPAEAWAQLAQTKYPDEVLDEWGELVDARTFQKISGAVAHSQQLEAQKSAFGKLYPDLAEVPPRYINAALADVEATYGTDIDPLQKAEYIASVLRSDGFGKSSAAKPAHSQPAKELKSAPAKAVVTSSKDDASLSFDDMLALEMKRSSR